MEKANKPCMDSLAAKAEVGIVKTVAEGLKPGSDVAKLSVLGYEPAVYYSGRSPLEAASCLLYTSLKKQVSVCDFLIL